MNYPKHVAIIPDGNRTRSKEQWVGEGEGHLLWIQRGIDILRHTFTHTPIDVVTWRWLSTENTLQRKPEEIERLVEMYKVSGDALDDFMNKHQINYRRIGNSDWLPDHFVQYMRDKQKRFSFDTPKTIVFAINYGGRDEIIRAVQKLVSQGTSQENITQESLSKACDLGDLPQIDLIIRTKADQAQRTSWFASWRVGYAELYFTEKRYPEFTIDQYEKALEWFSQRAEKRNYGK